tara:strand:+ start:360 stop:998 length:639 start_codon:yes stop_codon:yes gene_type:complete
MSNNKSIRITVASCLLFVSMVAGLFVYTTVSPKELTAAEYKQIGFYKLVRTRQINDFELIEGSNKFSNNDLKGAWDILFLGFASCPDMCPMTMKKMAMANSSLPEEISSKVNFRMISVDPDRDTPEKMQEYASAFNPNFSGITGDIEVIYKLATDLTLPFVPVIGSDVTNYDMDHSMNLAVIDPNGNYFGFFKSPHTPEKMAQVLESIVNFN